LVARVRSEFVIITRASGLGIGVGRFSRPHREVGVIAMPDVGLHKTQHVEGPLGAGMLRLLVPCAAVGVFINGRCVANGVEVMR